MAAGPDSDYGEELQWDDETEQQLAAVESASAQTSLAVGRQVARIEITGDEVEAADSKGVEDTEAALVTASEGLDGATSPPRSLWERFRKRRGWGGLSVSDLVGPSWCEVQHTYRLSSKSHLPPEQRPTAITTSTGASVPLNAARTVAREVVLDKGRDVHKVLEKAAMGDAEEVKVAIGQKEEWWALRTLNTAVCLETLVATGLAREIPVVGYVGDFLVFGVIDEIDRRELPTAPLAPQTFPQNSGKGKSNASHTSGEDATQRKLDQFFSPSPRKEGTEQVPGKDADPTGPRWGFVISDSKTRYNRSLPPKNESRASRLQLMLYHRLLSSLLTPSSSKSTTSPAPFDWPRLYNHLSLDPSVPFTSAFLASIQPVLIGSALEETFGSGRTLGDFVTVLQRYGDTLGARDGRGPFENQLEINYRLRITVRKWKPRKKTRKQQEEEDLKRAIAESLNADVPRDNVATVGEDEEDLARALAMSLEDGRLEPNFVQEVENVLRMDDEAPTPSSADVAMDDLGNGMPYVAEVAFPLPLSSIDAKLEHSIPAPSTLLEDLPSNSQAAPAPAARYNLRRRRTTNTPMEHPAPLLDEIPDQSTAPPKRPRPASPEINSTSEEPAPPPSPGIPPPSPPEEILEGTLIGTERFENKPGELDQWLKDVTSLWKGEREPRGVSLDQTSRCRTCEFEEGCEWRQKKAQEEMEKTRARNRASDNGGRSK